MRNGRPVTFSRVCPLRISSRNLAVFFERDRFVAFIHTLLLTNRNSSRHSLAMRTSAPTEDHVGSKLVDSHSLLCKGTCWRNSFTVL